MGICINSAPWSAGFLLLWSSVSEYETNFWGKSSSSVSFSVTGRYTSIFRPVEIKLLNQKLSTSFIFHDKIALMPDSFVAKCLWKTFMANKFMEKTLDSDTPTHTRCHGYNRWQRKRACPHLLLWELQNYNSLLNNHWQENIESYQRKILHIQGQRRSPRKTIRATVWTQRVQIKPCMH